MRAFLGTTKPLFSQRDKGRAKKTLSILENARAYAQASINAVKKKDPDFDILKADEADYDEYLAFVPEIFQDHWYATIFNHLLTQKARKMLKLGPLDLEQLGAWMDSHQKIFKTHLKKWNYKCKLHERRGL